MAMAPRRSEADINFARTAFSRMQSYLWSRCEIPLSTEGMAYQAVVRSMLLYGCVTWTVRAVDKRMLEVFAKKLQKKITRGVSSKNTVFVIIKPIAKVQALYA